jgi:drug/metabolite transporter (DMT)-like permease
MMAAATEMTEARGYAFVAISNLLFAIGFSFVSATHGAVSVWQAVFLRGVVFALVLLPWAVRYPRVAAGVDRKLLVLRGVLGTLMIVCLLSAVIALPLSIATLLAKTTPLWALLVIWVLFALRPVLGELLLVPVAVFGLALVLHPEGHLSLLALSHLGLLLALAAGLLNSLEFVTLNRVRRSDPAHTINLWFAAATIVITAPFAFAQPWPDDPGVWWLIVAFCLCSFSGQTLLAHGMGSVSPTIASIGTLLVPVFATAIAWLAFGDRLSALELAGIAVVLGAGALVIRMEGRQRAALAAATLRWRRAP